MVRSDPLHLRNLLSNRCLHFHLRHTWSITSCQHAVCFFTDLHFDRFSSQVLLKFSYCGPTSGISNGSVLKHMAGKRHTRLSSYLHDFLNDWKWFWTIFFDLELGMAKKQETERMQFYSTQKGVQCTIHRKRENADEMMFYTSRVL